MTEKQKAQKQEKTQDTTAKLAAVRIRGITQVHPDVEKTLSMLRLYRKNFCFVFPNTPTYAGMLMRVKDYITWGEIDDETYNLLLSKKAEDFAGRMTDKKEIIQSNDYMVVNNKKIKKFFRLNPPRGGFEKKGIKHTYPNGGALGYRGAAMKDLIKRMI